MSIFEMIFGAIGVMGCVGAICFAGWLYFDKYYRRKKFYRVLILTKTGGYKLVWARRTAEKTENKKYNIAKWGKSAFLYTPESVTNINGYEGLVAYENNLQCITLDFKTLEADSKQTLHPQILEELLSTKLISEILSPKPNLVLILLIVCCALSLFSLIAVFYVHSQDTKQLKLIYDAVITLTGGK